MSNNLREIIRSAIYRDIQTNKTTYQDSMNALLDCLAYTILDNAIEQVGKGELPPGDFVKYININMINTLETFPKFMQDVLDWYAKNYMTPPDEANKEK
jgi:hypothetical protein